MTPEQVRQMIREELQELFASDRYIFTKNIQVLDGRNIQLGRTTGTIIGTATDQKVGFWGKTPVIQQTAPSAVSVVGTDTDGDARTAINTIRTALINLGIIA